MRKILYLILVLVVLFILAVYISVSSTDEKFDTCVLKNIDNIDTVDFREFDSVQLSASGLYASNTLKKIVQGEQYREAWSAEISVPILYLDTLNGGLTVVEEGGGKQTQSLELSDSLNVRYALRSINKNPEQLIPEFLSTLGLENIVVDGISAQHPYAATVVAKLSESAQVLHTYPKIYFVPKQKTLGELNEKYGNRLFMLEFETESATNWTPLQNIVNIVDTEDLQLMKIEKADTLQIDKAQLIRSRLFDIVIGDWDRHTKQWGWVLQEKDSGIIALPLASDRDNAFFKAEGLLPTLITNKNLYPGMQSFEKDIDFLPGLVMPFDQYFLWNTPEDLFTKEAYYLQSALTDEAIANAFSVWPKPLRELNADEIISKIKYRRDELPSIAKKFHEIIQEKGTISEPLKGSKDIVLPKGLIACFECWSAE